MRDKLTKAQQDERRRKAEELARAQRRLMQEYIVPMPGSLLAPAPAPEISKSTTPTL